jgi:ATP-dependent Clp protease ATP-binding subunit ClpC
MTSNIGSKAIRYGTSLGFRTSDEGKDYESMKSRLLDEVNRRFNPEFLNRIDEIVVFHSLGKEEMLSIVDILFLQLSERLRERGLNIELNDEARNILVEEGFDPVFGARPLRRAIQRMLEDPLAEEILTEKYDRGDTIQIKKRGDKLVFEKMAQEDVKTEKV